MAAKNKKDMSRVWVNEMSKKPSDRFSLGALVALAFFLLFQTTLAVAPMPGTLEKWKAEGTLERNLAILKAAREAGVDAPSAHPPISPSKLAARAALGADAVDTLNIIVILVDFSDNVASAGDSAKFDSMLFSQAGDPVSNPTGSMTDYYLENSYGKLFVHGDVTHWLRMPNTYAFYRGSDYGFTNSPQLVHDACVAADPYVNFANYDNDNSGTVDAVVVVHAGKGAEEGGDANAIWSHRSVVSVSTFLDGRVIADYTMNPEKFNGVMVPIGVFCHEYGHILGLPDLYDTDYEPSTSDGLGSWSLMASGNYNGSAKSPAQFDPWCKLQLGFLSWSTNLVEVTSNRYQAPIPAIEDSATVYRIYAHANHLEYWLVENRQKTGFDVGLPGAGLLIYHIDNAVSSNNNYLRYKVALEQADGLNDLALTSSGADAGDPFPGSTNNRSFNDMSSPNAHDNQDNDTTGVGVWNISNSGSVMYADLDVEYSRASLSLWNADSVRFEDTVGSADGDGILEAGESADFYCRVRNFMRPAYTWYTKLTSDDPEVQLSDTGYILQDDYLMPTLDQGVLSTAPVRVTLPVNWRSRIVSFTLYVQADSLVSPGGDKRYADTFHFEAEFGTPRVLVVDDDEGFSFDTLYSRSVHGLRLPYRVWHKQASGSPSGAELLKYRSVIWMTGDTLNGGALNTLDISAITAFLNAGNNFAFVSIKGPRLLYNADSTFMKNYLHARWQSGGNMIPFFKGIPGNVVGDTFSYRFSTAYYIGGLLSPLSGGEAALVATDAARTANNGTVAVSYSGAYKSFIMTWGAEYVSDNWSGSPWATKQTFLNQILQFFGESAVTDVGEPGNHQLPGSFTLDQNYPNPFNPSTQISYTLGAVSGKRQEVNLSIFNLLGQKVKTLVDGPQGAGSYVVTWDGTNLTGNRVASGVYFYRLSRGEQAVTRKMLLVK
jgi:M6 family metalloprotease-like protein